MRCTTYATGNASAYRRPATVASLGATPSSGTTQVPPETRRERCDHVVIAAIDLVSLRGLGDAPVLALRRRRRRS